MPNEPRSIVSKLYAAVQNIGNWECSYTDAGDPWCVIYDRQQHRIILHIARIERRYVVVWPPRQRSMTTPTVERAIDTALSELVSMA